MWRSLLAIALPVLATGLPGCSRDSLGPDPVPADPKASCLARAAFGDPAASPYALPFPVGRSSLLYQGYCGTPNHGKDNQLAYDFELPLESPILAARSGSVVAVMDTHEDSDRYDSVFNYVFIQHDDDTAAFYAHLRQHSVVVGLGERVEAGQQIALLGHLGNPVADLLHFGVYPGWPTGPDDMAVNFRNADGPLDERRGLVQGATYQAVAY